MEIPAASLDNSGMPVKDSTYNMLNFMIIFPRWQKDYVTENAIKSSSHTFSSCL
jgi:hypothetical protein